jgi:hypothetical protein
MDGCVIHPKCETGAACVMIWQAVKAAFFEARDWDNYLFMTVVSIPQKFCHASASSAMQVDSGILLQQNCSIPCVPCA